MLTATNLKSNALMLVLAAVVWLQLCQSAAGQGTAAILPGTIGCPQKFCLRCITPLEAASQGPCPCPICPIGGGGTNPCAAVLCLACMPAQPVDAVAAGKTSVVPIGSDCCPKCG